jgi:uncharacterized RDD family membrane protein YckC
LSPFTSNVAEQNHAESEIVPAWKQELNQRLAATRTRRRSKDGQVALPGLETAERKSDSRAALLAAKVAQRYANAPSYSDVLAAQDKAEAEAEAALADQFEMGPAVEPVIAQREPAVEPVIPIEVFKQETATEVEEAPVPVEPLAVNLIEYPRELVAARKARPRLAEGPLRDDPSEGEQLGIFEVAPESISQSVSVGKFPAEWSPIRLDVEPVAKRHLNEPVASEAALQTAPLEDRLMAGLFDLALIVAAFAVFVLVFAACTTHPPMGKPALIGGALVLACFGLVYKYLFFKYAEGTPGMRYAKIALCTFDDENPTRQAMCRRSMYLLLSAAPLGLGFFWAWLDPDRLSWHDRMSRIYQRSYC